jgi:hypothetical protein
LMFVALISHFYTLLSKSNTHRLDFTTLNMNESMYVYLFIYFTDKFIPFSVTVYIYDICESKLSTPIMYNPI